MNCINFDSWKIRFNLSKEKEDELNEIIINMCKIPIFKRMTYLLNKSDINNPLEKIIHEICSVHLKNKNITYNENIFVEFWLKNNLDFDHNYMHIDKDEYEVDILNKEQNEVNRPFSSLVLYLNDNNSIPTVITKINNTNEIDSKQIVISFPRKNTVISFEGGNCHHGQFNINNINQERYIVAINIWNIRPLRVPYFNLDICFYNYASFYKKEMPIIKTDNLIENILKNNTVLKINSVNLITESFLKTLLFDNNIDIDNTLFSEFNKTIENNITDFNIFYFIEETNNENFKELDIKSDKLKQRFIYRGYFTSEICKWIIYESEKYASLYGGWTIDRHELYPTTDIPINKIKNIFNFLIYSFKESITVKIIKDYNLKFNRININLYDSFIVKYEEDKQCELEIHTDASTITATILLSENKDFCGGGVLFDDGLQYNLDVGDMLLHCGKTKHSGIKINKGKRYVLVFFINIFVN